MRPRRRSFVLFSLLAAVAAGGFAFTYWTFSQQAERFLRSPDLNRLFAGRVASTPRQVDPLAGQVRPEPRTVPSTVIVRRTYYPDCGDEVVTREQAGAKLAGKTAVELAKALGGGTIESFAVEEAVVLVTGRGACPKHAAQRYLGIADGHVAVFQGRPGSGQSRVLEVFDLEVGALPEREVADLRRGVPVRGDDELKRVLQSYLELVGF